MVLTAVGFGLLMLLPTDFSYPVFGAILLLIGAPMGLFASPNRAAVMNSLPRGDRGAGGAMNQTFQNSAQVLSIGIFFTLMIIGLASTLPQTMSAGLQAHGVAPATAHHVATLPPVSILFAAFLGYNPIEHLLGPHVLAGLSAHDQAALTGSSFFPTLISGPFRDGLHAAFLFAIVACLDRRRGVAAARRAHGPRRRSRTAPEGAACRLSGTDSPRSACDGERTVFIDPFEDLTQHAAVGVGYPRRASTPTSAVTHEHRDKRCGRRRRPGDPALDRGPPGVADRRGARRRLRARRGRGHRARARTRCSPSPWADGGSRTSATSGRAPCATAQAAALGSVDLLFVPVGGGPTIGADQAAEIAAQLGARVVVPMHYRTQRIDFLEPVDAFAQGAARVHRHASPAFEVDALESDDGPLVVVPAAP